MEGFGNLLFILVIALFLFKGPILALLFRVSAISSHELWRKMNSDTPPLLVDVRTQAEFEQEAIPGSISAPLSALRQRLPELKERCAGREVAVICRSGNRSLSGAVTLKRGGFDKVSNLSGGLIHWRGQGYPVR